MLESCGRVHCESVGVVGIGGGIVEDDYEDEAAAGTHELFPFLPSPLAR
jgi:hypothetical protein